jgi:hypothetical protein
MNATTFNSLSFDINTAGVGVTLAVEYCSVNSDTATSCDTWTAVSGLNDGTINYTVDGTIVWTNPGASWITSKENTAQGKWLRIRSSTTPSTAPTAYSATGSLNYDRLELSDGTPATVSTCVGCGTLSLVSHSTTANVGAGALSITRSDGKYLVLLGGSTSLTNVYNSAGNSFSAGASSITNAVGVGALALPRVDGKYQVMVGGGISNTSIVDPTLTVAPVAGSTLNVGTAGAGTVAFRRANGRFLITAAGVSNTNIFNPTITTGTPFSAGPTLATGTTTTGALAIPRPDGQALIVNGGSNINDKSL